MTAIANAELEQWVRDVVRSAQAGEKVEDSRVELKRELIDPVRAARELAGFANAARSERVLWIIGVSEKTGDITPPPQEISTWLSQVGAEFEEFAPNLAKDLVVHVAGGSVRALLFDTDRAPYVLRKNDSFSPAYWVPWREGASTRAARRRDLLRLLLPQVTTPHFEVLPFTYLQAVSSGIVGGPHGWRLLVWLYVAPRVADGGAVYLLSQASAELRSEGKGQGERVLPGGQVLRHSDTQPPQLPPGELIDVAEGGGFVSLAVHFAGGEMVEWWNHPLIARLRFVAVTPGAATVNLELRFTPPRRDGEPYKLRDDWRTWASFGE